MIKPIVIGMAAVALAAGPSPAEGVEPTSSFFASRVVEYSPGAGNALFPDPALALGGPKGMGTPAGGLDVVTLGVQGVARRGGRHGIRRLAGWLAWAGVMIIAAGAFWLQPSAADALPYVGAAVWLAGVLAGTVGWGGRSAR